MINFNSRISLTSYGSSIKEYKLPDLSLSFIAAGLAIQPAPVGTNVSPAANSQDIPSDITSESKSQLGISNQPLGFGWAAYPFSSPPSQTAHREGMPTREHSSAPTNIGRRSQIPRRQGLFARAELLEMSLRSSPALHLRDRLEGGPEEAGTTDSALGTHTKRPMTEMPTCSGQLKTGRLDELLRVPINIPRTTLRTAGSTTSLGRRDPPA